ncbi:restriction endonuclease subunit S [Mariniflexile jejuense]|uniref:Restriction endonuclease subunit S n=1 Tax=Mariniflexile jejuense TaxID=1173582 RepID=A0ABW3JNM8_9FLAO
MTIDFKEVKLGNLLRKIEGGGTPSKEVSSFWNGDIPWAAVKDFKGCIIEDTMDSITIEGLKNSSSKLIPAWTLVIPTRMALGKAAFFTVDVAINQDLKALYPKDNLDKFFLFHWFQLNANKILALGSGSTVKGIRLEVLKELNIKLPPLPEQQKIADILSTVDAKIEVIDQQITETQALKKGLMQRLLTKGIGHTQFKESPLGKIPVSWEVTEFKNLIYSHCYGPRFSSKDYSERGNVKTIRGTDINKTGDILYKQVPIALLPNDFVENHMLKDGDLVMITTADCGLTGVYFDQGFPYIPSAYAVRITLNKKAYPLYFKYVFQTKMAKNQVEKYIRKGTVANLPGSDILKFVFAAPTFEEQQEIANILGTVDEKLEVLGEKKTHYQALKQGLMQQLLTGNIRVKTEVGV